MVPKAWLGCTLGPAWQAIKGCSTAYHGSQRRAQCRAAQFVAAALVCAVTAAAAQPNTRVEQPRFSPPGVVSEVDSGLVTQVAQSNATAPPGNSSKPHGVADDNSGAVKGELEVNMSRQQVFETTLWPLFARRLTLLGSSAGHCVFDYRGTHQLRDPHPRFWPALNNNQSQITPPQAPYGVFDVETIMLPRQFTAQITNQAFDLAVLTLNRPVTAADGYFRYDCFADRDLVPAGELAAGGPGVPLPPPPPPPPPAPAVVSFRLNVAGYPANSDREMFAAFCANVTFDTSEEVLVQHECNTYSGMSGASLWEYESFSQTRRVCAVHKADALVAGVENLAAPLYAEAVKFIDDAIAGVAPAAGLPVTADSTADAAAGDGT